jgi:serine protease AprX
MVRQLTYVPANNLGVESATTPANSISLTSYPNPFSQSSTITFSCAESGVGEVTIVNLLGAEVERIFSGGLSAGQHSFEWDASGVPAGMYECVVRAGGEVQRIPILHY